MRFPGFVFGGASFGRDRRPARPSAKVRRRRDATHRLCGEALEGRAVLAVMVPAPMITGVTDDNGAILRTGARTNAAPLTISGTAATGVTAVEIFNGNLSLGVATPAGKTWSFATAALGEGTYNLRARAMAGTATSPASPRAFVVTVDTTAPNAPTVSNVLDDRAPVVGTVPRKGATNDPTLTLIGTAEPGSRVEVFADFNGGGSPVSLGIATLVGSTWRFTTAPLATDGAYSFTAKATDKAGNTSLATMSPYVVAVDTGETTPTITGIYDDVGNPPTDVSPARVSNDTSLELKGSADAGSLVRIFDGKTLLGSVRANNSGDWTFTARPLANGQTYRFATQATDAAGNTSALSAVTLILIDTTPPWRPLITGVNDGGKSIADRGVTNQTTLTISGRSEPGSTVVVYDGGTQLDSLVADVTGTWSFTAASLIEGVHPFLATATDTAGNTSVLPSVTYTVTVDLTAPGAPTIDSATDALLPNLGVLASGDPTNDIRPLFTGTTELGTVVKIYDGSPGPGTLLGTAAVAGTTWTFQPTGPLSEGSHTLNATATDVGGNESNAATFTIIIDTTAAVFVGIGVDPSNSGYGFGDTVYIDLMFDEAVIVDDAGGTPQIALNTVPQRHATYDSGSGTDTLRFKYEPQLGDKTAGSLDFAPPVIDPNGGTIRDAAGNDVNPTVGSLASRGITIDAQLTILLPLAAPPNTLPVPTTTGPGPTLSSPLPPLTITFNAALTNGLTIDSFDLFLEDRSMSTAGVIIENLGGNSYRLTLPPATHQSLKGRYRLDIGGVGSGIASNGVLMDTVVSLYWQLV